MIFYTKDQKKIHVEYKNSSNHLPTIVFLNGLSQTTLSWGFVEQLLKDKYNFLLLDFIFQGNSEKEGEWRTFDQHAEDVVGVLDQCNLEKVYIVGLSYGSIVAQHFAVNFPQKVSKLILLSTFAYKTPYYEAIELSWKRALELGGYSLLLDVMLPYVLSDTYFSHPIIPIDLMKSMRKDVVEAKALEKLMTATLHMEDFRSELTKINCQTLVIHGGKDLLFPVDFGKTVSELIPNAKFSVLTNAGHTLNLEEVANVCKLIDEFLS
jgi:3-oxoadipate enol-lactonase